ncbi:hypothetical protein AXF42_Ash004787 [Apostasia shenzhenica]|uniref:Uncharacterized protein n=1 Tax=Apostasia shenzhenica TaxID=1088818 RepID=A0A2I0BHP5_9ASPA|nr:hypothetical protein AXF42_Ash004787 [Apostasia shenzhenica]
MRFWTFFACWSSRRQRKRLSNWSRSAPATRVISRRSHSRTKGSRRREPLSWPESKSLRKRTISLRSRSMGFPFRRMLFLPLLLLFLLLNCKRKRLMKMRLFLEIGESS